MYKRQIDDIENIKSVEIYGSSKKGAYFSLSSFLEINKPFNGLYIIDNKIMVSTVYEAIMLKGKQYNLKNFNTISDKYTNKEYINEIDLNKMSYLYTCENVIFSKNISFLQDTNVLKLKYNVRNENDTQVSFSVSPLITYRDEINMKKANFLKFGSRQTDKGILVNLSIADNKNILLESDSANFVFLNNYINNIKHEVVQRNLNKDEYVEDLYLPGNFEITIDPGKTKSFTIYISADNFNIQDLTKNSVESVENSASNLDDEYYELKKLQQAMEFFENTKVISVPCSSSLEQMYKNLNEKNCESYFSTLLDVIKSIEGRYISLDKISDAKNCINECLNMLKKIPLNICENNLMYIKNKLWLVEIINKLYLKDKVAVDKNIENYIGNCILDIQQLLTSKNYEIIKNLEIVSLMYNCLKIYKDILGDPSYDMLAQDMIECITNNFWCEEKRTLKINADDIEVFPSIEMIYAISLSHSVAKKDIQIKLLDTIFRELYTPYGLRKYAKSSKKANNLVYPKYMAHFIKANLNQSGDSYATKKIAYNLVKELLIDIGKYVKDNVKYVYSEKGIDVDYKVMDLYTTSEMIRLYSMFM